MSLSEIPASESVDDASAWAVDLAAFDLTLAPRWRDLWFPVARSLPPGEIPTGLPADGFASPMGYWFAPAERASGPADAVHVRVHHPSQRTLSVDADGELGEDRGARTVTVASPERRGRDLTLVTGPNGADIIADRRVWERLSEPVLLVVAQSARFSAVERELAGLQAQAWRDHRHASNAGFATLRDRDRLLTSARAVRDLVSDWTHFAGLASYPQACLSAEASAEVYFSLADELAFEGRIERIDGVLEDLEQTYDAISEKLFHYRLFAWGIALEVVIVVLIALALW